MKGNYLALNRIALMIPGCWPLKYKSPSSTRRYLYKAYQQFSKVWRIYIAIFVLTQWIQIYYIPLSNLEEIVQNISTNLVYTIGIYQLIVCKQKKAVSIINTIYAMEKEVLEANNEVHVKIYKYYAKLSNSVNKWFMIMSACTVSLIVFLPLVETRVEIYIAANRAHYGENSSETLQRRLPLSSWFPFDKRVYYNLAYLLQGIGGYSGCSFVVYSDIFFYSIMMFAIGQIKILQNQIINFKDLAEQHSECEKDTVRNELDVLRECVRKHKMIIE